MMKFCPNSCLSYQPVLHAASPALKSLSGFNSKFIWAENKSAYYRSRADYSRRSQSVMIRITSHFFFLHERRWKKQDSHQCTVFLFFLSACLFCSLCCDQFLIIKVKVRYHFSDLHRYANAPGYNWVAETGDINWYLCYYVCSPTPCVSANCIWVMFFFLFSLVFVFLVWWMCTVFKARCSYCVSQVDHDGAGSQLM